MDQFARVLCFADAAEKLPILYAIGVSAKANFVGLMTLLSAPADQYIKHSSVISMLL
jgi:hypothetical protein